MEIKIENQGHVLGCLIRLHLENESNEQFATCNVLHPYDTFLTVCAPDIAMVRRALLHSKDDLKELNTFLNKRQSRRKKSVRSGTTV